jgi:riboflavin biosynthesis pyrimidine reductase
MRDITGAGLIGAGTLRVENPEMRGTGGRLPQNRIRAIITESGNISADNKKIFSEGLPPVVFTAESRVDILRNILGNSARVIGLPKGSHGLSLQSAVDILEKMGVDSLLIEGGGRLNYTALQQGIVDEIYLTIAPKLSGDHHAALVVDGPLPLGDPFLNVRTLSCQTSETGEIFVVYKVK